MGKRKPKSERTVSFNITLPRKMAARMARELAKTRRMAPLMIISRSQFYSHAVGEWLSLLADPTTQPSLPAARVRTRPMVERPTANGSRLTPDKVRAIRKDQRTFEKIARDMGVNPSTVARAKSGETWAWVD